MIGKLLTDWPAGWPLWTEVRLSCIRGSEQLEVRLSRIRGSEQLEVMLSCIRDG